MLNVISAPGRSRGSRGRGGGGRSEETSGGSLFVFVALVALHANVIPGRRTHAHTNTYTHTQTHTHTHCASGPGESAVMVCRDLLMSFSVLIGCCDPVL